MGRCVEAFGAVCVNGVGAGEEGVSLCGLGEGVGWCVFFEWASVVGPSRGQ